MPESRPGGGPRRFAAAAGAALVLVWAGVSSVPASASLPVAFPDGQWHGTSLYGGAISKADVSATAFGDVTFDLTVSNGEVTDGTLSVGMSATGTSSTATADLTMTGTLSMGGTAATVEFAGPVTVKGSASSGAFTVPIEFTATDHGTFSPSYVTCNQVTGDLAVQARHVQQAAGFATTVTGPFVAVRTAGGAGAVDEVMGKYHSLNDAMLDALGGDPSPEQVIELAQQYEALAAELASIGACESLPAGFESGLSDKMIGAFFQDLLQKALDHPEMYSAQALLSLLGSGLRMDAVGNDVAGSGPYQAFAKNLLAEFEATLESKLQAAAKAGDSQTVLDILVGAQQYGLDELANEAQGLLATGG